MRRSWLNALATVIAIVLTGSGITLIFFARSHAGQQPAVGSSPSGSRRFPRVALDGASFASWAMLDLKTGELIGSANLAAPGDTMSLVKVWIAADFLSRAPSKPDRETLERLSEMIRDSDNDIATEFHNRNGTRASIDRMVRVCGLTDAHAGTAEYRWSDTVISARDTARLGGCVADGRAAGPWTAWLLTQMRGVRGDGDFGPRKAFPTAEARDIAIKNGWYAREEDGQWHVSCLAIGATWSLGVLVRYPAEEGMELGTSLCESAGAQLMPYLRQQAP